MVGVEVYPTPGLDNVTALIGPLQEAVSSAAQRFPPGIDKVGCEGYDICIKSNQYFFTLPLVTTA